MHCQTYAPADLGAAVKLNGCAVFSLALLILIVVAFSFWVHHYTDYLQELVTILSFGGFLTWLSTMARVLPEKVAEALQWKAYSFFSWIPLGIILLLILMAEIIAFGFFGSLEIQVLDRSASSYTIAGTAHAKPLPSVSSKQFFFLKPPGGLSSWLQGPPAFPIRVKVEGYPDKPVLINPIDVRPLRVPFDLDRKVILFRPPRIHLPAFRRSETNSITIRMPKRKLEFGPKPNYTGFPIWVGCGSDVRPPWTSDQTIRGDVSASFGQSGIGSAHMMELLARPRCIEKECEYDIPHAENEVTVELQFGPNNQHCNDTRKVKDLPAIGFVLEWVIDCGQ